MLSHGRVVMPLEGAMANVTRNRGTFGTTPKEMVVDLGNGEPHHTNAVM